jgi:hypothetical protein
VPGQVEKVLDQPIIVVHYHGHVTAEDTRAVFAQVAGLLDTYGAPLYRITCVVSEDADTTFDEVMMMTTLSSHGLPGSATDPNVFTVLVGDHPLVDLFADAMRQEPFGAVEIPIFNTEAEALAFVQGLIDENGLEADESART